MPFNLREFSRDIAHWVDQADLHYYADASVEAERRDEAVEMARRERAAIELAARKQREAEAQAKAQAKAQAAAIAAQTAAERQAAEETRVQAEQREKERLAALSAARQKAEAAAAKAQAKAEAEARAEAEAIAEAARVEAEIKRLALEEQQRADAQRKKAEAALTAEAAAGVDRARRADAARKKAEEQARAAAAKSTGVERFLEDVDDTIPLNSDGVKYNEMEFAHLAHASNQYMPDGECQTCHHTQEGDDSPEACSSCHDIGGDAEEERKKTRAVHTKTLSFPKESGQEQVSCVGCHKSQNQLLSMGKRTGEKAPTKCTLCHTRNR